LPYQTIFRFSAILITALLAWQLPGETEWKSVVASLGFGHFALSLFYARHQAGQLLTNRQFAIPLILTTLLGMGLYFRQFPLVFVFAVHHVCNEVYLMGRTLPGIQVRDKELFRWSTMLLHAFAYLTILRGYGAVAEMNPALLLTGYVVSLCLFLFALLRIRKSFDRISLIDNCSLEIGSILLVALSFVVQIGFLEVVCYHFVFWCFLPLPKLGQRGNGPVLSYLLLTAGATGLFLFLSPLGLRDYEIVGSVYFNQFLMWSYIHVVSSFALSRSHPQWISRWFWKPRAAA
jgi:hypothetical protein